MVPMRSVPHRVVCLLGLDDGVFPRAGGADGDDLLARDPLVGERDPRSEDRQLLLDAIMAATEHLVIIYTGADERTGRPAAAGGAAGRAARRPRRHRETGDGGAGRDRIVVRHPLQPFDARNFTAGALGAAGRSASTRPRSPARGPPPARRAPAPPFLPGAAAADRAGHRRPGRPGRASSSTRSSGFLRQRLDVAVRFEPTTSRPTRCRSSWTACSAGRSATGCCATGWPGTDARPLPAGRMAARRCCRPAALGDAAARPAAGRGRAAGGDAAARFAGAPAARTVDVDVDLPGRAPCWSAPSAACTATRPGRASTYSQLGAQAPAAGLDRGWLALTAADTGHAAGTAVTVGRGEPGRAAVLALGPVDAGAAPGSARRPGRRCTTTGCASRCRCRRSTAHAYAARPARRAAESADAIRPRPRMRWASGRFPGEDADAAQRAGLGTGGRALDVLTSTTGRRAPRSGEPTRFGELALRLWSPLLHAEDVMRRDRPCRPDAPFDICGPLPTGTTVLEASAGTGKTYTIGALVTRYVAEGTPRWTELLRRHLRPGRQPGAARAGPRAAGRGRARRWPTRPRRARVRRRAAPAARRRRRRRGRAAPAPAAPPRWPQFDAATIATTHQFCQQVLTGLGVAGDSDPDARARRGPRRPGRRGGRRPLRAQVRRGRRRRADLQPRRRAALGRGARERPAGPAGAGRRRPGSPADVRRAVRRGRARRGRPAQAAAAAARLRRPAEPAGRRAGRPGDAAARDRMRARWSVVLVDEFQDTDPVQWHDPAARLRRARHAGPDRRPEAGDLRVPRRRRRHLPGRRRRAAPAPPRWPATGAATPPLLERAGRCSAAPRSATRDPGAAGRPPRTGAAGWPARRRPRPLRLRVVRRDGLGAATGEIVVADRPRTRASPATWPPTSPRCWRPGATFDGAAGRPGDVAVLVGTHDQGALIRDALAAAGVPVGARRARQRVRHPGRATTG